MSNSSDQKRQILLQPQTTIGARDLLSVGDVAYHGFLRKCGRLERAVQTAGFLKYVFTEFAKWRQKFVVISKGCLYIYTDELSTSPFQCLSLRGYDRVVRTEDQDSSIRRSFKLYSMGQQIRKEYTFGCPTESDRKIWMKKIKEEMKLANEAPDEDESDFAEPEDEYIALETQVKVNQYPPAVQRKPNRRPPAAPPQKNADNDDQDHYDKIKAVKAPLRHIKHPDLPNDNDGKQNVHAYINTAEKEEKKKKKVAPPVVNRPKLETQISRVSFEYQGSDRDKVQTILKERPEGTFLVRQSRTSDEQVLSVQTSEGVKEYKIFCKENIVAIDYSKNFPTVEDMVKYYKTHSLPHRTLSLSRGYSEQ